MLEQSSLRLLPWTWETPAHLPALPRPGWARRIEAVDRDAELGFARRALPPSWWGFGPQRLEVCETEDASLLMTIERGWFALGAWRVVDGAQCQVGGVLGHHLLDSDGFRAATIWHDADGTLTVQTAAGARLARIELLADGVSLLRFADQGAGNPFERMVLLAATILAQPLPR